MLAVPFFSRPRFRAEVRFGDRARYRSKTDGSKRVVLYTSGELHHDVLNQTHLVHRSLYTYLADPGKLQAMLRSGDVFTLVIDKKTFDNVVAPAGAGFEVLGVPMTMFAFVREPPFSS
jgi:hypothetical protein